jgi:adenine-specific DNA-methyltransferase
VRLFAIDEIRGDLTRPGYSVPLKPEFLSAHPTLVVDTRYFDEAFRLRLLAAIPDLDEETGGLLIHSENFQALGLLQARYREQVKCIYIDPPYNTGKDDFPYKDGYQDSSWLSMMKDRSVLAREMLDTEGIFVSSIGDHELDRLRLLLSDVFDRSNFLANFVWNNEGNIDNQSKVKVNHEYLLAFCREERAYPHALVIAPDVEEGSKLFNETIENSITKNGPANPPSEVVLPAGFPATFEEGRIDPRQDEWPHILDPIIVQGSRLTQASRLISGWSSRALLDKYIANKCQPVKDAKGLDTWFKVTHTGAIYCYKNRDRQSHVLSVIRNVGTVKKMAGLLAQMGFTFSYPKPLKLIEYICRFTNHTAAVILDYFAGSGTTAHAVINLNREDGGRRKFILVEMGHYFDTILLPRIKKVIFTPEWKDGKPSRLPSQEEIARSPRILKILRLESYEDTLNNLELKRTGAQQSLLEQHPAFRQDYILHYMLDVESRGSASLLNIDRFEDPFSYQLNIATGTAGETRPTAVDLVETFNYLIGLRVKTIDHIGGVRVITGINPQNERVLILWRNTKELGNNALEDWFRKQGYNTKDQEFDVIYVNGDNHLENLRRPDQTWKVRLIEEDFQRLMFDVQDV